MNVAIDPARVKLNDTGNPASLSYKFRTRRDLWLRQHIQTISDLQGGSIKILDLGGSVQYWSRVGIPFLKACGAKVIVLNNVASELKSSEADDEIFSAGVGDACNLPQFHDLQFDLVHSNSVIEHVGGWQRMKMFSAEVRRLSKHYYVQTPYFWFPVDPHRWKFPMIHWMPNSLQARIMQSFPVCYSGKLGDLETAHQYLEHLQMIDRKQFTYLFPEATLKRERLLGLTKSLVAIA